MNKIKISSNKEIVEEFNIQFKDVENLSARVKTVTKVGGESFTKVVSSCLYYNCSLVYYIPPTSLSEHIIGNSVFYESHIKPNIKPYSVDDLKAIDLSDFYFEWYGNLVNILSMDIVKSWFLFDLPETVSVTKLCAFLESNNIKHKKLYDRCEVYLVLDVNNPIFDNCYHYDCGVALFNRYAARTLLNDMMESQQ